MQIKTLNSFYRWFSSSIRNWATGPCGSGELCNFFVVKLKIGIRSEWIQRGKAREQLCLMVVWVWLEANIMDSRVLVLNTIENDNDLFDALFLPSSIFTMKIKSSTATSMAGSLQMVIGTPSHKHHYKYHHLYLPQCQCCWCRGHPHVNGRRMCWIIFKQRVRVRGQRVMTEWVEGRLIHDSLD